VRELSGDAREFADDLLAKVKAKQRKLCEPGAGNRTKLIKSILHVMAKKHKFMFHPYLVDTRKRREFLCDFVWLRWPKRQPMRLEQVGLVAECEWSNRIGSILFDFRKLMLMKSSLKLCVYQIKKQKSKGTAETYLRKFEEALGHYTDHRRGEHYFLLELDRKEEKPNLYFWRAGSGHRDRRPHFRRFK
jgi:hypothetical protein